MRASRIVFAFDARLRRVEALEGLAALAAQMQAELIGLFIEDIDLLHLAALPFAREVGYPSAAHRELDLLRMQRSLAAAANDLRHTWESVLKDAPVTWSFRIVRGSRAEQLFRAATEGRAPTLLIPPGTDPRAEPLVMSLSELTEAGSQALLDSAQRPILILP
jgi:hypothetical protein